MSAKKPVVATSAFGSYTIGKRLGEGGFSEVFAAVDESGRPVALKILKPGISTEKRRRLRNEHRFLERTRHANLIEILDSGEVEIEGNRRPFLVLPIYPATFRELIEEKLNPAERLSLFLKVLDGVEAAHLLGAVHRDLKPANILWDPKSAAIAITDFGIAHFSEDQLATLVETKPSDRLANFYYAAPEQKVRGARVDPRTDIFALGQILVELFTGEVPHAEGYTKISAVVPDFSYLDDVASSMIRQRPEDRLESIAKVKGEIAARGRLAVAQQELDREKSEIVPRGSAPVIKEVSIAGWDWENDRLTAILDQAPPPEWREVLAAEAFSFSSFLNEGPATANVVGNRLTVRAQERQVSDKRGHIQGWVSGANVATAERRRAAHDRQRRAEEEAAKAARQAAEARVRVLSKLN